MWGFIIQLVDECLLQTGRIRVVLEGLHEMVEQINLKTIDYAGSPDAMLEISDFKQKLEVMDER